MTTGRGRPAGRPAGTQPGWQLHRILLSPGEIRRGAVILSPANTRHVRDVLRLRRGDALRGLAPGGGDLVLRITGGEGGLLLCEVTRTLPPLPEPALAVAICQGLSRGDKMEYVLQKCTELGAFEFWPVITERAVVRPDSGRASARLARWRRIAEEAALQSGRPFVPAVQDVLPLPRLVESFRAQPRDLMLLAYEAETRALRDVLREMRSRAAQAGPEGDAASLLPRSAVVAIGPEGGFAPQEAAGMVEAGFIPVSLGPRVVRTETAGVAALAILLYEFGDLGGPGVDR